MKCDWLAWVIPPIMTKTRELLTTHLPACLADLAESFIWPWSPAREDVIYSGHYELCMEIMPIPSDITWACEYKHKQIVALFLEHPRVVAREGPYWSDCYDYQRGLSYWFEIACSNDNRALMVVLRDHGAEWCECGRPVGAHACEPK